MLAVSSRDFNLYKWQLFNLCGSQNKPSVSIAERAGDLHLLTFRQLAPAVYQGDVCIFAWTREEVSLHG